tara:strand:+ start:80 stop:463 length:384 start_codon:yes stop_codon:yes gene_type:complete
MAVVKINHKKRIRKKTPSKISQIGFQSIIEFRYNAENIKDSIPLVFVLSKKGKILNGINIGYLKEYPIEKLLEETNFKKLKNYTLYEKAFRTYKIKHISMVKAIEWETSSARRERKKSERKSNQLDK